MYITILLIYGPKKRNLAWWPWYNFTLMLLFNCTLYSLGLQLMSLLMKEDLYISFHLNHFSICQMRGLDKMLQVPSQLWNVTFCYLLGDSQSCSYFTESKAFTFPCGRHTVRQVCSTNAKCALAPRPALTLPAPTFQQNCLRVTAEKATETSSCTVSCCRHTKRDNGRLGWDGPNLRDCADEQVDEETRTGVHHKN